MRNQHETPSTETAGFMEEFEKMLGWWTTILVAIIKALPRTHLKEISDFWKNKPNGELLSRALQNLIKLPANRYALTLDYRKTIKTILLPGDYLVFEDSVNVTGTEAKFLYFSIERAGVGRAKFPEGSSKKVIRCEWHSEAVNDFAKCIAATHGLTARIHDSFGRQVRYVLTND